MKRQNVLYVRRYFENNHCNYRNCYFNKNGYCYCYCKEREKPLTKDRNCFLSMIEGKDPRELQKFFIKTEYNVPREILFGRTEDKDDKFNNKKEYKTSILGVDQNHLVSVLFRAGKYPFRTTVFFRDIFNYELKRRREECKKEEEKINRLVYGK